MPGCTISPLQFPPMCMGEREGGREGGRERDQTTMWTREKVGRETERH